MWEKNDKSEEADNEFRKYVPSEFSKFEEVVDESTGDGKQTEHDEEWW